MIEVISTKIVRTSKGHNCYACLRRFPTGTKMQSQTCRNDGEIYTVYACDTCRQLLNQYKDLFYDDGIGGFKRKFRTWSGCKNIGVAK